MERVKQNTEIIKSFLISLVAGYLVTFIGVVILALLLLQFQVSEKTVDIGIIVIYILSSFVAGYVIGKRLQNRKFLWGLITGLGYYIILLIVSLIARKQLGTDGSEILTTLFMCAGSGMLGGMIS